jgi:hypothetical protein
LLAVNLLGMMTVVGVEGTKSAYTIQQDLV